MNDYRRRRTRIEDKKRRNRIKEKKTARIAAYQL